MNLDTKLKMTRTSSESECDSTSSLKADHSATSSRLAGLSSHKTWTAEELISLNKQLNIDVGRFITARTISLVRDPEHDIEYFSGCRSGDALYYEELSSLPFYYMDEKWEFTVAEDIVCRAPGATLEIGSGPGHFLGRLKRHGIEHLGLEFNQAAVDLCRERGVVVADLPLSEVVHSGQTFKYVCAFQVLEHVEDPVGLVRQMLGVMAPGGALIISVPDRESFIRRFRDPVLDMPPHHMTRWSADSFRRIASSLNCSVVDVQWEPLAAHHVGWYAESYFDWLPRAFKLRAIAVRLLAPLVHAARLVIRIPGHTLLVVIRRDPDA